MFGQFCSLPYLLGTGFLDAFLLAVTFLTAFFMALLLKDPFFAGFLTTPFAIVLNEFVEMILYLKI